MLAALLGTALIAARLGAAQETEPATTLSTVVSSATGTSGVNVPAIVTATGTGNPCAQISSIQASYLSAYPSATSGPLIPASLAYDCSSSVPMVKEDATKLIEGVMAMLQFQSTIDALKSPPDEYPLPGVDLLSELSKLKDQVRSGALKNEIEFETKLASILGSAFDGHLAFILDGLSVFNYQPQFGSLVSVSSDGSEEPKIFLLSEYLGYLHGLHPEPSAITEINGKDAAKYAMSFVQDNLLGGYQDLDALYNSFFYSFNAGAGAGANPGTFSGSKLKYTGTSTSITFENGTKQEFDNVAAIQYDFTNVVDGDSFYQSFLNASAKSAALSSASATATATQSAEPSQTAVTRLRGYPIPQVISSDGSMSGYFFDVPGFEDFAVMALRSMSEGAMESFQESVTKFLDACRSSGKKQLVIDVSGNGGGSLGLGYDTFKQLFPSLDPYGAGNYRASKGYELLGRTITNLSSTVMDQQPDNYTAQQLAGATTDFAAETYLNASNQRFQSFDELYGPVQAADGRGSYTNLIRLDIANPEYDESTSGIVISGYANESNVAPQPFEPENIVLLSDGQCASTCAVLSHFLKWQAKVKSIAIGGRPESGPMQNVGGVKGSKVMYLAQLYQLIERLEDLVDEQTISSWNGTEVGTLNDLSEYLLLRTFSGGSDSTEISFNIKNGIAEGDTSYTPLQFVYEAADCRLYYQPQHIYNVTEIWATAAQQAFGLNGTKQYSSCVKGSTNQPSSLSGNASLYNNGEPTNVTSFIPENTNSTGNNSQHTGAGARVIASTQVGMIVAIAAAVFAL